MDHSSLKEMWLAQVNALQKIEDAMPAMSDAISEAVLRLQGTDGRLIYIGAGTSGRLGVQDGVELNPTFAWDRVAYAIAGEDAALTKSIEGAEDNKDKARAKMQELNVGPNDVCIAVAASGTTPYTIAACQEAKSLGALTVALANKKDAPLLMAGEHKIYLDSGEEVLVGSTRMAAGSVQKIALNMMSTQIMMDLGRVYHGRMVFVQATCDKLVDRAIGLIEDMSGCSNGNAREYLEAAEALPNAPLRVPSAILAAAGQVSVQEGYDLLRRSQDHFGQAFESLPTYQDLSSKLALLQS